MKKLRIIKSFIAIIFAVGCVMYFSCAKYEIIIGVSPLGAGDITVIEPDKPLYRRWQKVRVAAEPDDGCTFTGWTGAFESMNPDTTFRVRGDMTIRANFERQNADDETLNEIFGVENLGMEI